MDELGTSTARAQHQGAQPRTQAGVRTADGRHDIGDRDDLERLLRDFYGRALEDPLLRHVFVDVVHMDLEAHLPRITDFWQRVLFGTGTYDGQAMEVHRRVHQRVPLTSAHFDRWLGLWRDAVEAGFSGPVAEQAVAHATRMAAVFLRNLTEPRPVRRPLPVVARSTSSREAAGAASGQDRASRISGAARAAR